MAQQPNRREYPTAIAQSRSRREFLTSTVALTGCWALTGCGGGPSNGSTPPASSVVTQPSDAPLVPNPEESTGKVQVSATVLEGIRSRPERFLQTYAQLGNSSPLTYMQSILGTPFASLTDAGAMLTYASIVGFTCAPSGANPIPPIPSTLQQLLASRALACGHVCKLATMLALLGHPELIPPDAAAGSPAKPTVHFVAWLENVPLKTGLHSQLITANVLDDAYLLLDPLYAYALRIPYVGAGPSADLTVIENAVTMMQTPIASENLVVLDPQATASTPQMLNTVISGAMGPQYIEHDALFGSEGWDIRIAQIFDSWG